MIDIAMMVAGVGMQFFNNYANNKKNEELQAKQREFQRAAAEQDFDRMRKLQAESAKISLELEEELHKERINDINNQYDSILENFAHSFTISNWPLNVLPFIMKGESFGSLIHGSTKSINMHCIFTPSNCEWFNSNFYDDIDLRLEAEMNNNWNAQSTHPIVYYGGAWNRQYGETATIDLNDIDLLKINLRGIPTMVVTPYFDPWLHFRVEIWGMGKDTMKHFRIDIPHGDVEFANRIFSYDYNKNENNIEDEDFQNSTVNEFVSYLEKLIGYVADKYFWSMYNVVPRLPQLSVYKNSLYSINQINFDYSSFIGEITNTSIEKYTTTRINEFLISSIDIEHLSNRTQFFINLLSAICNAKLITKTCTCNNILEYINTAYFTPNDLEFLYNVKSWLRDEISEEACEILESINRLCLQLEEIERYAPTQSVFILSLYELLKIIEKDCNDINKTIIIEISKTYSTISYFFIDDSNYLESDILRKNISCEVFLVPQEIKEYNPSNLKIKCEKIKAYTEKIAFDCDVNMFPRIISIDYIKKYCTSVIDNVVSCTLNIKEAIPNDIVKGYDSNIVPHLLYCIINGQKDECITRLFYYDSLEEELYEKLLINNQLIIQ